MEATIHIDPSRQIGQVDDRIFSSFIEHLGKCIYGGILPYKDSKPDVINESGFRADVLKLVRDELKVPVVRWPGGNFVSSYRWKDGVGPKGQRPRRPELAWGGEESNQFGTDDFIKWCREARTEPYICLNMGTGTLEDALDWVEYCNGTGNTYWANKRREYNDGDPEPYRVKYWGLGNEMYGAWQVGNLTAAEYTRKAQQWAHALKLVDPSIVLISCGNKGQSSWDATVLQGLATQVDLHSIHTYTSFGERDRLDGKDFERKVFGPEEVEEGIRITRSLIDLAVSRLAPLSLRITCYIHFRSFQRIENGVEKCKPIKIAFDEWGAWDETKEHYDLTDSLAVASWLNVFIRNADIVAMANYAQLVNVIAPILTSPDQVLKQTIFHPLYLFSNHMRGTAEAPSMALDLHVESPSYNGETLPKWIGGLRDTHNLAPKCKYIDASAAFFPGDQERVAISIVNRHPTEITTVAIKFFRYQSGEQGSLRGEYEVYSVYHHSVDAMNTFEDPNNVAIEEARGTWKDGNEIHLTMKEHSSAMLVVPLRRAN
ncbi:hypothetical protein M407DRAFT_70313 [Tulasnella calospora MUT 4182]|uniref:non-reducing end alpha-L-arabinofuranosidase n=1 Tax=Tulasnella calospora MUT 4182 TaxID=1051891 RepID=A0A0C3QQ44_9AGAM|nr:hypothetical protein M407DRAFT_70313 [Tulasnella calospora MUT 4182]